MRVPDSVGERIFDRRWAQRRRARDGTRIGVGVDVIRGDDGDAIVVVTRVENVPDGFKSPERGLTGTEIIEKQDFNFHHWIQDAEFGGDALSGL